VLLLADEFAVVELLLHAAAIVASSMTDAPTTIERNWNLRAELKRSPTQIHAPAAQARNHVTRTKSSV
jgi:hypothetical protein